MALNSDEGSNIKMDWGLRQYSQCQSSKTPNVTIRYDSDYIPISFDALHSVNFSSTRFALQRTKLFLIHGTDEMTDGKGIIELHLHMRSRQYKIFKFSYYKEKKTVFDSNCK